MVEWIGSNPLYSLCVLPLWAIGLWVYPLNDRKSRIYAWLGGVIGLVCICSMVLLRGYLGDPTKLDVFSTELTFYNYSVGIDIFRGILLTILSVILLVGLSARGSNNVSMRTFYTLLYLVTSLSFFAVCSENLFTFMLATELMTLASYILMGRDLRNQRGKIRKFLFFNIMSSSILISGFIYISYVSNNLLGKYTISFFELGQIIQESSLSENELTVIYSGFMLVFLIRMGFFPFHNWFEDPVPTSGNTIPLILNLFNLVVSTYGMISIANIFYLKDAWPVDLFIAWGVLGLIYGLINSWQSKRLRTKLHYLFMSNASVILLGIFLGNKTLTEDSLFQMFGLIIIGLLCVICWDEFDADKTYGTVKTCSL